MSAFRLFAGLAGAAVAAYGLLRVLRSSSSTSTSTPATSPAPSKPRPPDVAAELVNVATRDLPDSSTVLGEPSPRWDEILGGRKGPGQWGYYEAHHGTSCGVVAAAWLEGAGGPPSLINRAPPGGNGFVIGKHITKLHDGAKAIGWLREPTRGELPDLAPGMIYGTTRPAKDAEGHPLSGEHVGVILSVHRDGDVMTIETADGGQEDAQGRQAAKRKTRTVLVSQGSIPYSDGSMIPRGDVAIESPGAGNVKLAWWIATGGDPLA